MSFTLFISSRLFLALFCVSFPFLSPTFLFISSFHSQVHSLVATRIPPHLHSTLSHATRLTYIYIYLYLYIYYIYIYLLCSLYTSTFSMKIISSAPCFVALVHHPAGAGVPETGSSRLRSGHRPINTRTGSPVPAT